MQLELDFTPGLTQQYPELIDLVATAVYASRPGLSGVAVACDLSPGLLSRMLRRPDREVSEDRRHLPVNLLPKIVEATGDLRIVYWFVERFLEDRETRQARVVAELGALLPVLARRLEDLKRGS